MLTALFLSATLASAQTAPLPPAIPWNGASRGLVVPATDPWVTPAERGQLRTTPRYDETVAYLKKLVAAAPQLRMVSIGKSGEGRDLWMVIASKERAFTPEALRRNGKPTLLAQGGIHAGEIDGKDAGLMLLRDLTVRGTKRELLDGANFLFVPIFNVDGHERFTRFTRHQPARSGRRRLADEFAQPEPQPRLHEGRRARRCARMIRTIDTWTSRPLHRSARHRRRRLSVRHHVRLERRGRVLAVAADLAGSRVRPAVDRATARDGSHPRSAHLHRRSAGRRGGPRPERSAPLARLRRRASHGYGAGREPLAEAIRPARPRHVRAARAARCARSRTTPPCFATPRAPSARGGRRRFRWPGRSRRTRSRRRWSSSASRRARRSPPISGGVRTEWLGQPVTLRCTSASGHRGDGNSHAAGGVLRAAAWSEVIELPAAPRDQVRDADRAARGRGDDVPLRRPEVRDRSSSKDTSASPPRPRPKSTRRRSPPARSASPPTRTSARWPSCCSSPRRATPCSSGASSTPSSPRPSTSKATSWSRWPSACWPRTRSWPRSSA